MVDVATILRDLLSSAWEETDPTEPKWCIQDFGMDTKEVLFDPNACYPQIALEETEIKNVLVSGELYKREHTLSIIVYLRPVNYQPTTIEAARETFMNMINQVDEILKTWKFTTPDLNDIQLSTWRIQTKKQNEPIVFVAAQEIKAIYYD